MTIEIKILLAFCVASCVFLAITIFWQDCVARRNGDIEKVAKAKEYALAILSKAGLMLFTEAERTYGSGTGKLKMSAVIGQLIALLPDEYKQLIDTEWLQAKAETFLSAAKKQWESNGKMLNVESNNNANK